MLIENALYRQDIDFCAESPLPWERLAGKSVLISGATGMIGSMLVDVIMRRNERFGDGIRVLGLARGEKAIRDRFALYKKSPLFQTLIQDVSAPLELDRHFDYIIHAASNTHPAAYASDPIGTITTNVTGTNNLLRHAVAKGFLTRFAFLSTVEVYGENRGDTDKFDESYCGYMDCNTLRAGYPESKRAGEALCNAYAAQYGVDIVIPRLCRIYGPTMRFSDNKALAQFIKKCVAGEDIVLKSRGNQFFSYLYVADCVNALFTILLCGNSGEAYNVSDAGSDITLRELAEYLAEIAGKKVVFAQPDTGEAAGYSPVQRAVLNNTKLLSLGWQTRFGIHEGLERTVDILRHKIIPGNEPEL